ncbi:MAG: Flp pilus assembly protein CpaB [Hyphomicrobiaceae bacterium]
MRVRIGTLNRILAAGLCAGVATYLTVTSVGRNAPSRAVALPPIDVRPPPNPSRDTKTVIIAAAPLRFGTTLTPDVVAEMEWPSSSVPVGAFTSREALLGPAGQRTVLASIAKNEPILAAKITGPGQRGTLSAVIDVDMKAVTIRVDDVLGVAGFVQPDDRVDVLMTRSGPTSASHQQVSGAAFSDLLLQNVRVLAIDQIADRSGQAKPAKAVTIEVTTEDAQRVALGASVGQLSLALRQAGSLQTTEAARRISLEDLGKTSEVEGAKSSSSTIVTVTRGARERILYEVTPSGRRELQGTGHTRSDQPVALETGVSQVIAKPQ